VLRRRFDAVGQALQLGANDSFSPPFAKKVRRHRRLCSSRNLPPRARSVLIARQAGIQCRLGQIQPITGTITPLALRPPLFLPGSETHLPTLKSSHARWGSRSVSVYNVRVKNRPTFAQAIGLSHSRQSLHFCDPRPNERRIMAPSAMVLTESE
jgi:hypothetical protein